MGSPRPKEEGLGIAGVRFFFIKRMPFLYPTVSVKALKEIKQYGM